MRRLASFTALEPERGHAVSDDFLVALCKSLSLPLQPLPSLPHAEQVYQESRKHLERLIEAGAALWERNLAKIDYGWSETLVESVRIGSRESKVFTEVQVIGINDSVLVAIPAEPFVEIGLAIKQKSAARYSFIAGYSNGCIGYLPTEEATREQGYEVNVAHKIYGYPMPLSPTCGRQVVEAALELIEASNKLRSEEC